MKKYIWVLFFIFNMGLSFAFSCEKDCDFYTLAPSSYFRGQQKTEFKAPEFDPVNYEAYQKKQAEFEENIRILLKKDVTLRWKEKYKDEQSASGKFKEITSDRYGRVILVLENSEGELNIYLSELTAVESSALMNASAVGNIHVSFSDDVKFDRFPESIPQEIIKEALASKLSEIAQSFSPLSKSFQIQKVSYIAQGTIKKVFRVEVMTDQGPKVFGLRLIQPVETFFSSSRYIEGAIEELDRFRELRELNGVAIDVKSFYSYDDFPNNLSMHLLGNCIYGMSIGEYVEGETLDHIKGENQRVEAYRQAVKTILRTWLLTVNGYGQGYTIGDLKGANMIKVSEKLYESMSPVVFIDFGDIQNVDFVQFKIHVLEFLRSELGLVAGSQTEREYIVLMRDYLDEFLREKGDSLKKPKEKMIIIDAAKSLMEDYPYLSEMYSSSAKAFDTLSMAA